MWNLQRAGLVAFALAISVQSAPTQEVCTAEKCVAFAKHLKDSLSPNYQSIDPCVDFDKYSCEGWRGSHEYRPDQAKISVTSVLSDQIRDTLHAILEGQYAENNTFAGTDRDFDVKNFQKLKTAYNTCMNEDAIKAFGVTPIRQILDEFEAIYPTSAGASKYNDTKAELTNAVVWLSRHGKVSGLLSSGTTVSKEGSFSRSAG
jgi:endothelin-converting enzyme